jgi:hypothetical protein
MQSEAFAMWYIVLAVTEGAVALVGALLALVLVARVSDRFEKLFGAQPWPRWWTRSNRALN